MVAMSSLHPSSLNFSVAHNVTKNLSPQLAIWQDGVNFLLCLQACSGIDHCFLMMHTLNPSFGLSCGRFLCVPTPFDGRVSWFLWPSL